MPTLSARRRARRAVAVVLPSVAGALVLSLGAPPRARAENDVAGTSSAAAALERADELILRLRRLTPEGRDAVQAELLDLATAEDALAANSSHPVHERLRQGLLDPDPEVRYRVRRVLSDPEVKVERVMKALADPAPEEVVRATLRGLASRPDRDAARAGLLRIARKAARAGFDPHAALGREANASYGNAVLREHVRFHMALDLLGEIPATTDAEISGTIDLLRDDLGDSLFPVLTRLAQSPELSRRALRAVLAGDPNAVARENAAWALGELGTPADLPVLTAALGDQNPRVRRAAVLAFEILDVEAPGATRAAGLASDPDPRVSAAALRVGALFGHRFVGEVAQKILLAPEAPSPELRLQAVRTLGTLGDRSGALRQLLAKPDELVKVAAWATGAAGDLEGLGAVEGLLDREEFSQEPALYYGMARAGVMSWLERQVKTSENERRRHTLAALGSARGDPAALAELLRAAGTRAIERSGVRNGDWNDFVIAFRALRDRNDGPSRLSMGRLLDQALGVSQRGAGIDEGSLGSLVDYAADVRSRECLGAIELLAQRHPTAGNRNYVRDRAIDALSIIDPAGARKKLLALLEAESRGEMSAALSRALARAGDRARGARAVEHARATVQRYFQGGANPNRGQDISGALNTLGIAHAYVGATEEALACFRRMRWVQAEHNVAAYNTACVLALAGRREEAFLWLRRSIREGFRTWRHIEGDADFDNISKDPRFKRIVQSLRVDQEIDPVAER